MCCCAFAALTDLQQVKELQDIIKGQQRFVVLPAFEPMPIKERFVENMSGAAMSVVLRQQQKVAAFAAANEKATLQVCELRCAAVAHMARQASMK